MNVIVRSPNWIGDCIMALPAIRALHHCLPGINISLAVKNHLADIYKNIPEIHQLIPIPSPNNLKSLYKTAALLHSFSFDHGILFTNSFQSALLFKLARIPHLLGYKKDGRSLLLSTKLDYPHDDSHFIQIYQNLSQAFIQKISGKKCPNNFPLNLVVTPQEKHAITTRLTQFGIDMNSPSPPPLIGIAPSAAYGTAKQWLPERFTALISQLTHETPTPRILLFGSANEYQKISTILHPSHTPIPGPIYNLAGQLTLRQTIEAISLCHLFIGHDSGLMHTATSFQIPVIAIFGPTKPAWSLPLHQHARVIYSPQKCSPCRYRDCPTHHACMTSITLNHIMQPYHDLISNI